MNIYNVLDKLKAIAEKDPHYKDAVNSAQAYEYKTVSEGVHGEKCNECGMYESHCECPTEELEEAKPDFLDLDKDGNKKESMKKAAADKKAVKESPELQGILRHAGIAMITPSGTMANQADSLVESIEKTKSILNENYSGGLNLTPVAEVSYSAKKARAGQDIGKPGKQFAKIAKSAGERYGSKERGEKVAGAVLAKLRAKEGMEEGQYYGGTFNEGGMVTDPTDGDEMGEYNPALGETGVQLPSTDDMGRDGSAVALGEREFYNRDTFDRDAEPGDTFKTDRHVITKTKSGRTYQSHSDKFDGDEDEASTEKRGRGRPKKAEKDKSQAHLPWGGKAPKKGQYKEPPKLKGRHWGKKGGEKFEKVVKEGIDAANIMIAESYPSWKREIRAAYPGVTFKGNVTKCQAMVEGVEVSAFKVPVAEKAVSRAQQRFMGMVHAAQKGEKPASPEVAKVAKGMSKKAAHDFAATKHKGLPAHVEEDWMDSIKSAMSGTNPMPSSVKYGSTAYPKESEEGLEEVSRGEYIKQQDAAAEKAGKKNFAAFGQEFSTKEIDETIAMLERMKALAGMPVKEESESEEDDKAEKAGKKVAKDIEHDDAKDHDDTDAEERDDDAEEDGEKVAKDIEHDDKEDKEEKDQDDKEEKVDEAEGSGSKGIYGKGVYESYENQFQELVAEDVSVNTSQSTTGGDTVTITATEEDAHALVELLKAAGMGSDVYQKYDPSSCEEEVTEENSGNSTEGVEYNDTDELVKRLSGGLNGMKLQYAKGYQGDNDVTTIKGQAG